MEKLYVKGMSFGSYLKFLMVISLSNGLVYGIILFILSIFGGNVYANIGTIEIHGVFAGIINIFLSPLIFAVFGLIISLLSFLPVKFALKLTKGIKMNIDYEQNNGDEI